MGYTTGRCRRLAIQIQPLVGFELKEIQWFDLLWVNRMFLEAVPGFSVNVLTPPSSNRT